MVTGIPRRLLRSLHLYLSLAFGVLLVLAGLTGVGLTWIDELDVALNPALLQVPGRAGAVAPPGITAERVAARLARDPRYRLPGGLQLPRAADGVVIASYRLAKPGGDLFALPRIRQVMVDPVTLVVLGERNWGEFGLSRPLITSTLFHLHRYLFAGEVGKFVMGLTGLALFLIGAIGIALWWPKATLGALVKSFRIHGHWKSIKFQYSFHRSAGMIMAPVLLMLGFSGLYFNLPEWVRPAVASVATLTPTEKLHNAPARGARGEAIGPAAAIAAAQAVNPAGRIGRISLPADPKTPYEIRMRQPGEVRQGDGSTRITVDAYTGQLLRVRDPLQAPAGDTFLNWQFPLHTGEAFGLAGRIVITVAGVAPLAFMVTGLVLWLGRRRKSVRQVQPARPAGLRPASGTGR